MYGPDGARIYLKDDEQEITGIVVFDLQGNAILVDNSTVDGNSYYVDTSVISNGLYVVNITLNSGQRQVLKMNVIH